MTTLFSVETLSAVETESPGQSRWFSFWKAPFSLIVPVLASIVLLKVSSLPSASVCVPSLDNAVTSSAPLFSPSVIWPSVSSGSVKMTAIGWI